MNHFRAYAHPVHGGFHAMVRLAHNAEAQPVKAKGGNAIVYVSELDAHKAATAHLEAYFNGDLKSFIAEPSEGDQVLAKLGGVSDWIKQKGRERRITVERRAARG